MCIYISIQFAPYPSAIKSFIMRFCCVMPRYTHTVNVQYNLNVYTHSTRSVNTLSLSLARLNYSKIDCATCLILIYIHTCDAIILRWFVVRWQYKIIRPLFPAPQKLLWNLKMYFIVENGIYSGSGNVAQINTVCVRAFVNCKRSWPP